MIRKFGNFLFEYFMFYVSMIFVVGLCFLFYFGLNFVAPILIIGLIVSISYNIYSFIKKGIKRAG